MAQAPLAVLAGEQPQDMAVIFLQMLQGMTKYRLRDAAVAIPSVGVWGLGRC